MKKETTKLPRGFKLIGQTKKAVLRAKMGAGTAPRHSRRFGNRSPLDRLPYRVKCELRKRCRAGDFFREIRAWLWAGHRCSTSVSSLSAWWKQQQEIARKPQVAGAQFEFIIHAPGAREIRVLVKPR